MIKYILLSSVISIISLVPSGNIYSMANPDSLEAEKLYKKAGDFWRDVQYDSSNFYYEKASSIFKKDNNWERYIDCQNNIGINDRYLGRFSEAIEHLNSGLDAVSNISENQDSIRSEIYNNMGAVYYEKGYYDRAWKYYNGMLQINERVFGTNNINTGKGYQNVGLIYYSTDDYDRALQYLDKAASIFSSKLGNDNPLLANCYTNMSKVYQKKGEYSKSIEYEQKAVKIWIDKLGESHPYIAMSYNNLAGIYIDNGDYSDALEYDYKAMQIRRDIAGEESRGVAQSYAAIGDIFTRMQNFNNGRYFLDKSIAIYKKIAPANPGLADTYILSGNLHRLKSEYKTAEAYYDSAVSVAWPEYNSEDTSTIDPGKITNKKQFLTALIEKGTILYLESEGSSDRVLTEKALNILKSASDVLEKIKSVYLGEEYELLPDQRFYEMNKNGILAAVRLYGLTNNQAFIETAFQFSERNKAKILAESLTNSEMKKFTGVPDSLIIKEKELSADISFYEKKLEGAEELNDLKAIGDSRSMLLISRRTYDDLNNYLKQNFPAYYKLMYPEKLASTNDLRKLLASDEAVLDYFTGDTTITIFLLTGRSANAVTVPCNSYFTENVIKLRRSLPEQNYINYLSAASELYSKLIGPVKKYLGDIERLYIIPDRLLAYLPFEVLLTRPRPNVFNGEFEDLPYLINDYQISYQYSAGLLKETLVYKNNNRNKSFAAFVSVFSTDTILHGTGSVDSTGGTDHLKDISAFSSNKVYSPDPQSVREVESIAELFKENDSRADIFMYKSSIRNSFKTDKMNNYKFIHLAVQTFINEGPPAHSGLIFYNPQDSADTGVFYDGDILNLKLNTDLLVMSQCEISLGSVVKGAGIFALVRSFLYAGAGNIIIPLWQNAHNSTSFFMTNFYENVLDGMDYDSALRQAKLEMIEEEQYSYPLNWGSFILIGR